MIVPCAWCGKKHELEGYKDDWIDREDYIDNQKEFKNYPHAFAGKEVHIYFPVCPECREEGVA